ncbi:MAG TPA: dihydrodipicolinate synthase family protein [Acidimicrobiia bacterium]|jgi:4-hydroxy-tetrahydrodipicolinate synthase
MAPELRGVIGACLTPFDASGSLDIRALARQIEYTVHDVDALAVVAVEASEYRALDEKAREAAIRTVVAEVGGRVPVIAGASDASAVAVVARIEFAAAAGADLAQVLIPAAPWGGRYSHDQLVAFFGEVDQASPLPVVAYHNPSTGTDLDIATYVALSELRSVTCFKESSRDITKISRLVHLLAGKAAYFTTMQPMLITLLLGGAGATMPPPATRIAAMVRNAFDAGDLDTAVAWQQLFSFFPGGWGRFGLAPLMKAAMRHVGVDIGDPVPPHGALPADIDEALGRFIGGCGLVGDLPAPVHELRRLAGVG